MSNPSLPERLVTWTFWLAASIVALVIIVVIVLAGLAAVTPTTINVFYLAALLFGGVIGWVTYRTLRREGTGASAAISDITSVISAVGGTAATGVVTRLVASDDPVAARLVISWYFIGLFLGFFIFYLVALFVGNGRTELLMGKEEDT